ncbi:MAG: hypothetical protein O8C64_03215 [Candidatus Methanoperedens sp.]|nr:hypothetical protein [Candidatus Methanoperedens sp.]MCZ7405750.1 hypothetical protein [Candidatus Methanoperedens sp.]
MEIGETKIKLKPKWTISKFAPSACIPETTTTFRFPDRGDWATQINRYARMARLPYVDATSTGATVAGNYRGNWSPYIPLIPFCARGYHQTPVEDEEHEGEVVREEV